MSDVSTNKRLEVTWKTLAVMFFIACVVGWLYETILEVFVYKTGFSNRGFLFGPWLPVYGFGVLAFFPGFLWLDDKCINKALKIVLTAILCALVASLMELVTSYILEFFTGGWLWDYSSRDTYHFQGRIALDTSLRFGVGGMLLIYGLMPLMMIIQKRSMMQNILCGGVILMIVDLCITLLS